jgi:Rieske Fe-S protein
MTDPTRTLQRRTVLLGAGALGVGCTGCSVAPTGTAGDAAPAGTVLGPAADVPVGSGRIYVEQGVLVTQATEGQFTAFSTVCPHQGCNVDKVTGESVRCPCHGSTFALDGSVVQGPATSGLASRTVSVEGGQLTLG